MDINVQKNASRMMSQWFLRNTSVDSKIKCTTPRPPYNGNAAQRLPDASPESQGIQSAHIISYYERLKRENTLAMQTVTIARSGYVISRGQFYPYTTDIWHVSHSLCKSLTGLAIGILVDDGLLSVDDKIVDIFADELPVGAKVIHRDMRIKHLLTMSTGIVFNETGELSETNWVRAFLESSVKFKPGTAFDYNSMNTYMLSATVCKITGGNMSDFLKKRVFEPLGIKHFFWETCPRGIEKGGWGLYFYPEDMLRVGFMMLNGGIWEGKRIVSEKWLKQAMKKQINTPAVTGKYDYGYQMWCKNDGSLCVFNGMFGQNLMLFPKINLIIMSTAGNDEMFQRCDFYEITERFFGGSFRPRVSLEEDETAYNALLKAEKCLVRKGSDAERVLSGADASLSLLEPFIGKYEIDPKDGYGLSLMTELMQGAHNNFREGLIGVEIGIENGVPFFVSREADGDRKISFGLDGAVGGNVSYGGETIMTMSYATVTSGDVPRLHITVCYPELPNVRYITVYAYGDKTRIKWEESPGYRFAYGLIKQTVEESLNQVLVQRLDDMMSSDFFHKRLKYFLQPTVTAKKISDGVKLTNSD